MNCLPFVVFSHNPICGRGDGIGIASGVDNTLPVAVYSIVNFLGWIIPFNLKKNKRFKIDLPSVFSCSLYINIIRRVV